MRGRTPAVPISEVGKPPQPLTEVQAASTSALLSVMIQLTHRIHAADAIVTEGTRPRGREGYVVSTRTSRAMNALEDARSQRDLVRAEVLRRCGE